MRFQWRPSRGRYCSSASVLNQEDFCWLGFFTSEPPNHTKAQDSGKGVERGPFFHGDCTKECVHPDYGCQMFMLAKEFIPGMCRRMRESPYPHGIDRWFFMVFQPRGVPFLRMLCEVSWCECVRACFCPRYASSSGSCCRGLKARLRSRYLVCAKPVPFWANGSTCPA